MHVKVIGAGSIGNHLSHAARCLGWRVDLVDSDPKALERSRKEIYPSRYGEWDSEITLYTADEAPTGSYDFIFIGTPPDNHISLALAAVEEGPSAILVEKPLCGPDMEGVAELSARAQERDVAVFVGYDHVVGEAAETVVELLAAERIGRIETIDVEFREYWGGIFAAHPWLSGPADTYLGFWRRGGGASGEHSHAANLWQHVARKAGCGEAVEVDAMLDYHVDGTTEYDKLCSLTLRTESGMVGRVVQDVVTAPPRKMGRVQGSDGFIEWWIGYKEGVDAVFWQFGNDERRERLINKIRPDDFIRELRHISETVDGASKKSPISLANGIKTMRVIAAAHQASENGNRVRLV